MRERQCVHKLSMFVKTKQFTIINVYKLLQVIAFMHKLLTSRLSAIWHEDPWGPTRSVTAAQLGGQIAPGLSELPCIKWQRSPSMVDGIIDHYDGLGYHSIFAMWNVIAKWAIRVSTSNGVGLNGKPTH